ncbi:MAG: 3-oxoacyl-ACP reductase FabG [Candidatus Eremiobacteraeota bacterium]|nr:3-oxoacyl-ACP reductase FabG [Candidatus Eremiobacteraeota bacterium]MBC5803074.1 3-oxoacyl-ACP reductase FabG [Candidatus Eremiobacteraeota bacterium]MBC5823103.1 3-oxoacyl-ACP reductase FabG [Candidatus Eremiobacteraeota bacterium]
METKRAPATAPDPTHPKPLLGRVAIVTGGSRGIGSSIARELAASGATVVVNYIRGSEAAAGVVAQIEAAGGSAGTEAGDVSNYEQVGEMFGRIKERYGRLDVLVNNAGILRDRTYKKMSITDWHEVIDTNLGSVMNCCHLAVPMLLDNGWGRIINISSFVGQMGNFGQANYSAAKAGILGFTKTLAIELARFNITVNAVCPGFVETEMWKSVPENIQEKILERIPMHRVAKPEEIARGVRFFAIEGDYMTGQSLNINGGIYMGW